MVKITIECDDFFATTENPETAKTLLQMAGIVDCIMIDEPNHIAQPNKMIPTVKISAELDEYLSKHDGEPLPITGANILDDIPTGKKLSAEAAAAYMEILKQRAGIRKCSKMENPTISETETVDPPVAKSTNELPPFNPLWTAANVDLDKNYLQQYSNPCSTLHGNCGGKCVQTELWLRNKKTGNLSVCDAEFKTIDELRKTLDPYVKLAARANAAAQSRKLPCSRERLEQLAKLFNAGKTDAEIMEQYHISANSAKTYRAAAKRCGLLNN